jgi:hypothetical protein
VAKEPEDLPKDGGAVKRNGRTGSHLLRMLSTAQGLLGPVLNLFAGIFHVLAEAVGRVAADADNGQEGGGKEQENETLH